ncbi:MAG: penicillin acylase family protein [Enterobacterales bacterium]|nr:penicillin acylase family protein [Enterobacterales bacterium]
MTHQYKINRDSQGVAHIYAQDPISMIAGQGFAHARDRGMQMLLMRIIGQGRIAELLDPSQNSIKIDHFFRRMNWYANTAEELNSLPPAITKKLDAYCDGVNQAFSKWSPFEFKLVGYKVEPWTAKDSILISRMVGYLTLAQSQAEVEKLILQMIQNNLSVDKLEALFPAQLGELDNELIELIKQLKLDDPIVDKDILWACGAPRMMASNNWVISGKRTRSGKPILASDPHLEVNRLPNVWYEMCISAQDSWTIGSSMPGLPGILIGRNKHLSWGATYAFVDSIDSWIERCEAGKFFREEDNTWRDFKQRKEIIKLKKGETVEVAFFENELGTLEGDPYSDKYCLITQWAAANSGKKSVQAVINLLDCNNVQQGMEIYGQIETGWNYVFADTDGNIGYQMSGRVPIRREGISGLIPLPAWKKQNHWQGFIDLKDMPRCYNPPQGYFCTANNDLNCYGKSNPINLPMGSYRADRIAELLEKSSNIEVEDIYPMQYDTYSKQAEVFMPIIKPLLDNSLNSQILKDWDFCYNKDSKGAYLFETIYRELYLQVFGGHALGEKVVQFLQQESGTFIDFYAQFDTVLLAENSIWFNGKTRQQLYQQVIEKALQTKAKEWREVQSYNMKNIFFDGKLPGFLGFDKKAIIASGGRATICQGQIYRAAGRDTTFMPSYRMVTDMADDFILTNLAGGPSDRRFSKWYTSDLQDWLDGRYKKLEKNGRKSPFP